MNRASAIAAILAVALFSVCAQAGWRLGVGGTAIPTPPQQTIQSINLSNQSFIQGSPDGSLVGLITVTMNPASPPYAGSAPVLGGADASSFRVTGMASPWSLVTNGVQSGSTYNITLTASQAGMQSLTVRFGTRPKR